MQKQACVISLFLYIISIIFVTAGKERILEESICRLHLLPEKSFELLDISSVFWIPFNKTMDIIEFSARNSPMVCQSFTVAKQDNSCYSFVLEPGLYKIIKNNTLIAYLSETPWQFSLEEYNLDIATRKVKIYCVYGYFSSCLQNSQQEVFGLSENSLHHFDSKSNTVYFFGKKYGDPFKKMLTNRIHWPTICFERNTHFTHCNHRQFYNTSNYSKINDTRYFINSTRRFHDITEYKIYSDGSFELCNNDSIETHLDIGILSSITIALYAISITSLFIHVISFLFISELQDLHGKIVLSFVLCLLLHDCLLIVRIFIKEVPQACNIIGILIHFLRLSYFSWNWIIALNLYLKFKRLNMIALNANLQLRHYLGYCAIVLTFVLFIITASVVSDEMLDISEFQARYGHNCDASNRAADIFFLAPSGIVLLTNIILYILAWRSIQMISFSAHILRCKRSSRKIISCFARLTGILVLSWIFILTFKFTNHLIIRIVFNILIAFQGFYIFFTVSSPAILKFYRQQKINKLSPHNKMQKSITSTPSSDSFKIPPILISRPSSDSVFTVQSDLSLNDNQHQKGSGYLNTLDVIGEGY